MAQFPSNDVQGLTALTQVCAAHYLPEVRSQVTSQISDIQISRWHQQHLVSDLDHSHFMYDDLSQEAIEFEQKCRLPGGFAESSISLPSGISTNLLMLLCHFCTSKYRHTLSARHTLSVSALTRGLSRFTCLCFGSYLSPTPCGFTSYCVQFCFPLCLQVRRCEHTVH